jgi:ribosomal protein L19E
MKEQHILQDDIRSFHDTAQGISHARNKTKQKTTGKHRGQGRMNAAHGTRAVVSNRTAHPVFSA